MIISPAWSCQSYCNFNSRGLIVAEANSIQRSCSNHHLCKPPPEHESVDWSEMPESQSGSSHQSQSPRNKEHNLSACISHHALLLKKMEKNKCSPKEKKMYFKSKETNILMSSRNNDNHNQTLSLPLEHLWFPWHQSTPRVSLDPQSVVQIFQSIHTSSLQSGPNKKEERVRNLKKKTICFAQFVRRPFTTKKYKVLGSIKNWIQHWKQKQIYLILLKY